jgi:NADPH:quinone reductase-like Zn-dependent oxidoreductase
VPAGAKAEAALAVNKALEAGWGRLEIAERFPLKEIARAHESVERLRGRGRVIVTI